MKTVPGGARMNNDKILSEVMVERLAEQILDVNQGAGGRRLSVR